MTVRKKPAKEMVVAAAATPKPVSLPSASKLYLGDACPASLALPRVDTAAGEAAETGTIIHQFIEDVVSLTRNGTATDAAVARALLDVPEENRERCEAIDFNKIPTTGELYLEVGFDLDLTTGKVVVKMGAKHGDIKPRPGHAIGVADHVEVQRDANGVATEVWVFDWKTGFIKVAVPSPQLRMLACAAARWAGVSRATVGNVQILADGKPRIVTATMDAFDLGQAFAWLRSLNETAQEQAALFASHGREALTYRQGNHCAYCPAWDACYASTRTIALLARAPLNMEAAFEDHLMDGDPANAVDALVNAHTVIKRCWKAVYQHIRTKGPIAFPDGTVMGPAPVKKTIINGRAVVEVLNRANVAGDGVKVDPYQFVTFRGTKTGIKKAASVVNKIRKEEGKKSRAVDVEAEIMAAVAMEPGGILETESVKIIRHRPGEVIADDSDDE